MVPENIKLNNDFYSNIFYLIFLLAKKNKEKEVQLLFLRKIRVIIFEKNQSDTTYIANNHTQFLVINSWELTFGIINRSIRWQFKETKTICQTKFLGLLV